MSIPLSQPSSYLVLAGICFRCGEALSPCFQRSEAFTVEGWIGFPFTSYKPTAIFSKPGEITLGLTPEGHPYVEQRHQPGLLIGPTSLEPGLWHHLAVTFDGRRTSLYVKGIRDAHRTALAGSRALAEPSSFHGEVWNFRIWKRSLTAAQVFRATWEREDPQAGLAATFFPELPPEPRRRLGRTDNPPRVPMAA